MNRRRFIGSSVAAAAAASRLFAWGQETAGLAAWAPGFLEIHHIATNRGNSTLLILPDGTTMLVDAGAIYGTDAYLSAPKPSAERRPGEWIGRYAERRLKAAGLNGIDVFMSTHLHADHMGAMPPGVAANGEGYVPTGVSDVAGVVPIRRFVDRAWPDYSYPAPLGDAYVKNYRAFLMAKQKAGATVERFRVGVRDQFKLQRNAAAYPGFEVRNLAGNGEVWTGQGEATAKHFPEIATLKPAEYPSENSCSCAIRMRYGRFSYYTGGDLNYETFYGRDGWRDVETPVARVCGPVSVAVANHHGYFEADGPEFVRALQPRVFVILAWDSAHPTVNTLDQFLSKAIYPGERDGFATLVKEENHIANKKTDSLKSRNGHVVVRVDPGGETYRVHVLTNEDESGRVVGSFGPYTA